MKVAQNRFSCDERKEMITIIFRVDIVNKKQYEESENFKEIIINIPKSDYELEKDFEYLGLDYNNLSIQDTHVVSCEVIDREHLNYSKDFSKEISKIIERANENGYTTPFNEIVELYRCIKDFKFEELEKASAILVSRISDIKHMQDAIKYMKSIDCFELYCVDSDKEFAKKLIYNAEIDIEDVIDYADLSKLGRDYIYDKNIDRTDYGYLEQQQDLIEEQTENESVEDEEDEELE